MPFHESGPECGAPGLKGYPMACGCGNERALARQFADTQFARLSTGQSLARQAVGLFFPTGAAVSRSVIRAIFRIFRAQQHGDWNANPAQLRARC